MIQTFDLCRKFGSYTAVDQVNLKIDPGEVFGFLGLNGAGKTTVMRMICGLLRPTNGYAQVGKIRVQGSAGAVKLISCLSFVSQEMRFHEQATLKELLAVYAALANAPVKRGIDFARQVGVPLDRPCGKFSPGQQRKAQLAIAMLKQPEYLFLDEPSAGLDPNGVAEMRDILLDLNAQGATIFFSSHILGEVQSLCSKVGILHRGKIRYVGMAGGVYTFTIDNGVEKSLGLLQHLGIAAWKCAEGVQLALPEEKHPAVVDFLGARGIQVKWIKAASLEDTFRSVVNEDQEVKDE